ncbi:putative NTP binding protein [Aspergillus mulundensis]|uniref:NTP binding protein n=1 Tax=Aspergillus mulundensis TaxID=1810919 RepID=A0A3D8SWX4_9EURO|nr:hypothetical protein DSM5745_02590 [Aspergillus mulundensis]RDW90815.1 hypothetical protein DSM5745_02590 [Aspergillus mulundensis]
MAMAFDRVNGHLLNIQPRPRRSKDARHDSDAGGTRISAVELAIGSDSTISEADTPATSPPSKATPTKLPVLKVSTDKDSKERKDTAASCEDKGRDGSPEYVSPKSLNQDRERYWQKIRDKVDRESLSPRDNEKEKTHHHGAYRKIMSFANSSRHEISKQKWKYSGSSSGDKLCTTGNSHAAEIGTTAPEQRDGSKDSTSIDRNRFSEGKGRMNSNHSASSNESGLSSQKSKTGSTTTESSYNSNSSVSPISGPSGPSSSIKDWEDRFVVHMPSAREPNPPTLNVGQIAQYQRSIEKVQKEGGSMVDPDTLPSPRTTTPEHILRFPEHHGKRPAMLDGQDSRTSSSDHDADSGLAYHSNHPRYYCPDEIGKRFSTIWEESSSSPKQKPPPANPDGSFLGCKEINGPHRRNPDEILYFSMPERPKVVNIPPSRMPRVSKDSKPGVVHRGKIRNGETRIVQDEWEPISRNLKHAQCSKLSPRSLCREGQCQQLMTKKSTSPEGKGEHDPTERRARSSENQKPVPRADDVFIITPTITRTMVTMTDLKGHLPKPTDIREPVARSAGELITDARTRLPANPKAGVSPLGLRRATQHSWVKSNAPSAVHLDPARATNIPAARQLVDIRVIPAGGPAAADKPRGMRGFIRTPGIPRSSTESRIDPPEDKASESSVSSSPTKAAYAPPRKSTPYNSEGTSSQPVNQTTSSPTKSPPQPRSTMMHAKITDVAELDGHQVDDHQGINTSAKAPSSIQGQTNNKAQPNSKGVVSSETLHMLIDIVFLFVAQVQHFCCEIKENRGSKVVLLKLFVNGILGMLEHCLHVLRKGLAVISAYNSTGVWPKTNDKDLAWLFTDLGQAIVYLVVLGFIVMVIARAVGFMILIGTWLVWFARPFALTFRTISRVLFL